MMTYTIKFLFNTVIIYISVIFDCFIRIKTVWPSG